MDVLRQLQHLQRVQDINYNRAMRRERVFRDRDNPFDRLSDECFRMRFRLSKNTVRVVTDMVREDIEQPTRRNHAVPCELQVLLALRFYATGGFQLTMADLHGLSQTTVCTVLKRVTNAIARLRPRYISFSNNEEMNDLKERFFNIAGFHNCIGAIDCSHIRIIGQGENGQRFINRKGWSSINVQAVNDSNRRFVNIVAHWHGSVHDSRIFDNSLMKQRFE
ncbi:putative nuclease HARBI1 [Gigantopelta aegis]|uniref:putative nuclease HARBI1 n=1 Tax=Gigantopelta aegis TaxID=1735272 RepID=UPI001B889657|nr:putative nuclease HARBI1 [Gigantopelta aegis]